MRASREGSFGTEEKRVPELEKERLQFLQRLLKPLVRVWTGRGGDQSIIIDFCQKVREA